MKATILLVLAGLALTNAKIVAEVGPVSNAKIVEGVTNVVDDYAYKNQLPTYASVDTYAPAYNPVPDYVPAYSSALSYEPPYNPAPLYAAAAVPLRTYAPAYAPSYAAPSYDEGPNNWSESSTKVNTGGQSAVNKGSTYSSNANVGRNVKAKTSIEKNDVAQAQQAYPQY